jgi:hypothetical protein
VVGERSRLPVGELIVDVGDVVDAEVAPGFVGCAAEGQVPVAS